MAAPQLIVRGEALILPSLLAPPRRRRAVVAAGTMTTRATAPGGTTAGGVTARRTRRMRASPHAVTPRTRRARGGRAAVVPVAARPRQLLPQQSRLAGATGTHPARRGDDRGRRRAGRAQQLLRTARQKLHMTS